MDTVVAAIYARISQDKTEGLNVADQVEKCRAFILARGWTIGEVYSDNSISATTGDVRPAFERMLVDAPAVFVTDKQDRVTRGAVDTLRIKAADMTGYLLDGGRVDFSTADSEMVTMFRTAIDAAEGRKKAERQKSANLRNAKAGKYRGSIRPFGQTLTGEWVEREADAVRAAARSLVVGEATFYDVAVRWNADGLLTPQTGRQGGREWTAGTVRNFYTRPRLVGKQDYQGTLHDLRDWTPLLDADTFGQLQTLIDSKRTGKRGVSKGRGDAHLLTGIVRCECGRGMNVAYRGAKGSARIYRCPTVKHQSVTAVPLERVVAEHALDLMAQQDESKAEAEEATRRISELLDEKRSAESEHDRWITEAVVAALSPALIAKRETAHAARLSGLDAEVMQHRQILSVNFFDVYYSWDADSDDPVFREELRGWDATPVPQRRDVLLSLFDEIRVSRGGQGQRFQRERVSFSHTPLGDRLYVRWAENMHPEFFPNP